MSDYGPPQSDFPWKPTVMSLAVLHCFTDVLVICHQRKVSERKRPNRTVTDDDSRQEAWRRFQIFKSVLFMLEVLAFFYIDIIPAMWSIVASRVQLAYSDQTEGVMGDLVCFTLCCLAAFLHSSLLIYCRNEIFMVNTYEDGSRDLNMPLVLLLMHGSPVWLLLYAAFLGAGVGHSSRLNFTSDFIAASIVLTIVVVLTRGYIVRPSSAELAPLEDGELRIEIQDVATAAGYPLKEIYKTEEPDSKLIVLFGWPRSKYIVVGNISKQQISVEEATAITAREIGYWKHSSDIFLLLSNIVCIACIFVVVTNIKRASHFWLCQG